MPFLVDVEATIDVPDMYAAPMISFSYPGNSEPSQLWNDLAAIGWEVPERPFVPYQASSWTGSGRKERGHAYRVEGFEVFAGHWDTQVVADRGLETINLLRRCGVDVHMPITYLDFLRKTQLQQRATGLLPRPAQAAAVVPQAAAVVAQVAVPVDHLVETNVVETNVADHIRVAESVSEAIAEHSDYEAEGQVLAPVLTIVPDPESAEVAPEAPVTPAAPVANPNEVELPKTILLSTKAWSVLENEPGLEIYQSVVVPGRTKWTWSESTVDAAELGSALPDPRILFDTVELGWQRSNDEILLSELIRILSAISGSLFRS